MSPKACGVKHIGWFKLAQVNEGEHIEGYPVCSLSQTCHYSLDFA